MSLSLVFFLLLWWWSLTLERTRSHASDLILFFFFFLCTRKRTHALPTPRSNDVSINTSTVVVGGDAGDDATAEQASAETHAAIDTQQQREPRRPVQVLELGGQSRFTALARALHESVSVW